MDQVIRSDGRIIRLIERNKFKDPKDCPIINVRSDGHGFYEQSLFAGCFQAIDVTRLWSQR